MERAYFLERVAGGDGVDEKESLACAHVLFAHSTTGSVSRSTRTNVVAYPYSS